MNENYLQVHHISQRVVSCFIQSLAKYFPKHISDYSILNKPTPKYLEANGVWGRLMENYQPRMKASCVFDLCVFPFYYALALLLFSSVLFAFYFCEKYTDVLLFFLSIFLLYSFPFLHFFTSSKISECAFFKFFCKNAKKYNNACIFKTLISKHYILT